jgi:hypothetical protein
LPAFAFSHDAPTSHFYEVANRVDLATVRRSSPLSLAGCAAQTIDAVEPDR